MTIPALATADKLFICSYNIGSNVDHRYAMGVINELTTVTNEYIDGFCWIPVKGPQETTGHSWFYDLPDKSIVYVKVGCRVSSDGYMHTWLISSQSISELILWNNSYNTDNQPEDDTTTLHWALEKLYYTVNEHSASGWDDSKIQFQQYIEGETDTAIDCAYLDDGGVFTDYTTEFNNATVDDVELMPATEVVNDAFYFGYSTAFPSLKLNIGQAAVGTAITWEYWDGAAWSSWSPVDNTDGFTILGTNIVAADEPGDWATTAVNGSTKYWIRARVSTASFTTQPLLTQGWIHERDPAAIYLFGNYNNSLSNPVEFTDSENKLSEFDFSWYPNNSTTVLGDYLFTDASTSWILKCEAQTSASDWADFTGRFGKAPNQTEPKFWKVESDTANIAIDSLCNPTDSRYKQATLCHHLTTPPAKETWNAVGNNSARVYPVESYPISGGNATTKCAIFACSQILSSEQIQVDMENNRQYIEDPPGTYNCDPAFTYDTSVSFTYNKYTLITADEINYLLAKAEFNGLGSGIIVVAEYYYPSAVLDIFDEAGGDTDELKHGLGIENQGAKIYTLFTQHVAAGILMTNEPPAMTINNADWKVQWGAASSFNSWIDPEGLAERDPGTTNAVLTRPLTHHDNFNTSDIIQGGFCNSLLTSNGFLSRNPGTETKRTRPADYNSDFTYWVGLLTSAGLNGRDPGTETKRTRPCEHNSDFTDLYGLLTSAGFNGRDPGMQPLYGMPVSLNADFQHFHWLISPFAVAGSGHYARDGSSIVRFGNSYSTLAATTQSIGKVYEDSSWLNLIVAGDQDELGNTVAELSTKCRVKVGAVWKSVPRVGDPVGTGFIVNGCPFFLEVGATGGSIGIIQRLLIAQAKLGYPVCNDTDFTDLFALLTSDGFDSRDPTA